MCASIRFHPRTLLIGAALFLMLIIVVVAAFVGLQRVLPAQTHIYRSYGLYVTPSPPWHPGQTLSLQWTPKSAPGGSDAPPPSVTCAFTLYGPYATRADAQADSDSSLQSGGVPLAASAPPLALSTDGTAPAPTPVAYTLPATLAPGYYVVIAVTDLGDSGGGESSSWVVQVTA